MASVRGSVPAATVALPDAINRRFLSRRSRAGKLPIIAPCCSPPSSRGEAATKLDSLSEVAKYPAHVRHARGSTSSDLIEIALRSSFRDIAVCQFEPDHSKFVVPCRDRSRDDWAIGKTYSHHL